MSQDAQSVKASNCRRRTSTMRGGRLPVAGESLAFREDGAYHGMLGDGPSTGADHTASQIDNLFFSSTLLSVQCILE